MRLRPPLLEFLKVYLLGRFGLAIITNVHPDGRRSVDEQIRHCRDFGWFR